MRDRTLITTGAIGAVLAAICCLTPLLVVVFGAVGLTAWLAKADYVLIPALILCLALVACSLLWCLVRTRFVSLRVSMLVSILNNIYVSLLTNLLVAVIFFSTGRVALRFVALLWHLISTLLAFAYPPTRVPTIQEKLWAELVAR